MKFTATSRFFTESGSLVPRFREAGDLTLDRAHRDARIDGSWLSLKSNEFEILWLLAEKPGAPVAERVMLAEISRMGGTGNRDELASDIAAIRDKLDKHAVSAMLAAHPVGGYSLDIPAHVGDFTRVR